MGIYIKKMEMPKSCSDCPILDWDLDYIKCKVTGRHFKVREEPFGARRVDDCPLVPVPPHGRLIDADAFLAEQRHLYCENCERRKGMKNGKVKFVYDIGDAPCRACGYGDVLDDIDDAPTIIEAEGGE